MLTREEADAFLVCLETERYYDAHETLEALWFPVRRDKSPEVLLLKGLINASVSFELHKRHRPKMAPGPWNTYLKYRTHLASVGAGNPLYHELDAAVMATKEELDG